MLTWLLGEFINFERFAVFVFGMVITYLLTCSRYTGRARPLLMVIIVVECVFVERQLVNWYLADINMEARSKVMVSYYWLTNLGYYLVQEGLHFVLWIARYLMALLCLVVLVHCYWTYRNYEVVNYELLNKIIEQNRQIKRHLKLETEEVSDEKWPVTSSKDYNGITTCNDYLWATLQSSDHSICGY